MERYPREEISQGIARVLTIVLVAILFACGKATPPPEKLYQLQPFELVTQEGAPFHSKRLLGKTWVASFIFTSCRSICPKVTAAMKQLQSLLEKESLPVKLVTFTVDPENDVPEVLKAYGDKVGSDYRRWVYLTSKDVNAMQQIVVKNFKTAMGQKLTGKTGIFDIAHTEKLVLVGPEGYIRGYFESIPGALPRLVAAAKTLMSK